MYIRSVKLERLTEELGYAAKLPAVKSLAQREELEFKSPVTYFVGENGTGKSTLLEAIAVKCGFNAEGGSLNFSFSTKETHSPLHSAIKLVRGIERPKTGFFLRAELRNLVVRASNLERPCNLKVFRLEVNVAFRIEFRSANEFRRTEDFFQYVRCAVYAV